MTASLTVREKANIVGFDESKIDLLKNTICKGATDDELELFLHACTRTGLDPFMKQIHAVKRYDSRLSREVMSIQTGIDGYRLIAERTGRYCPGKETTYTYDANGGLVSATAYVKKLTSDGTWHEIPATAFYSEYCQRKKDGSPMGMWGNMPHGQLGKCAEALALRKAFPAELSGVYTKEEMQQADVFISEKTQEPTVTEEQAQQLDDMIGENQAYREVVLNFLKKNGIAGLKYMPVSMWEKAMLRATQLHQEKQKQLELVKEA